MIVYYLNDEQRPMTVRILDATYDPNRDMSHTYHILKAAEGRFFEVVMDADCTLYIKKWKDIVMLSYLAASAVKSLRDGV